MPVRRAPIVLGATAMGLAATLGFQPRHAEPAATAASSSPASAAPASSPGSSSAAPSSTASSAAKTATGDAAGTPYGNVQLKVTVAGGKITKIEAVQLPANDPKSQEINAYAEPLLRQSALSKQDGTVDAVSGATFTSDGYRTALQSALDKAGFAAASSSSTSSS
jgi:uncharacterized protein with FMN-binding domain